MALKMIPKPSKTSLATRPHNEERKAQAVVKTELVDAPNSELFQTYCDSARDLTGFEQAKVASSYFAEDLAKFIRSCNMQSIGISLGPCGSLTITAKFDVGSDLKMFESRSKSVFEDIKTSFDFIQTNYSGVYLYTFEAESAATEITLN